MKDFRSLEHKIRDMQIAEAEARNTALRKKVVNVGRPDTAEDPVDVKSKLAKQGEIKTKIIDEADEAKKAGEFHFGNPDDLHAHLKKAHADKNQDSVHRAIKGAPTHSLQKLHAKLKPQDGERQQHRDKELFHLSIGGELKRRGVKEEVESVYEAAPKQGQIQDMEKVDKEANSEKDPKKITGGKTEVDLKPTTNDAPEEQSVEDSKEKKTKKEENKKIGQKGAGDVKEEALDELSKETLRSYKEKSSMPKKDEQPRQSMNRMVGMARAMRRIHAKDHGINYNAEEVEQIDEKNWIAGAIKHKGALHKQLHVPADEPIPAEKLNAAAEKGGKLGKRARLAKTLKRIVKEK